MTITAGLGITLLEARQSNPDLIINDAVTIVDRALSGRLAVNMTGLATSTISNALCAHWMINPYGTPSGDFNLIVNGNVKGYLVINDTAFSCTFKSATGATVVIPAGKKALCYFDGTNMHAITDIDSGWIDASLSNSWANTGGSWAAFSYRAKAGFIYLRGQIGHASATTGSVIATFPTGYRPSVVKQISGIDAGGVVRMLEFRTNGEVVYQGSAAAITRLSFDGVVV